jgi:hypothetical protein
MFTVTLIGAAVWILLSAVALGLCRAASRGDEQVERAVNLYVQCEQAVARQRRLAAVPSPE